MKSLFLLFIFFVSTSLFGQDMDSTIGADSNHGVSQGCEGNGCQYSSPSSRRRARQRFRDEEMKNIEQMESSQERPEVKVQSLEDTQ